MAFPDINIEGLTPKWEVLGDDITGVSDGGNITTQWVDRVASTASSIQSGSPTYVADAYNGHAGVRFTRADNDILKWPLTDYGDSHCFIAAGVFTDTGAAWAVAIALEGSSDPTNQRTLFAHRYNGADLHAEFNAGSSDETRAANSSVPAYTPDKDIFCGRHGTNDQLIDWFYKAAGTYGLQENDAYSSFLESFDHVYVGGDAANSANAMSGDILYAAVCEVTTTSNSATDALVDLLQHIDNYFENLNPPPETPILTLDAVEEEGVHLSGSDFIDGQGGTHDVSQWEIALATDPTFSSPVYNPGDDGTNLTTINITGLQADQDYIARLRYHEDPSGLYSGWSNTVSFTTTFATGPRYDPISPGGNITMAGLFWRENDTDNTECRFISRFYDASKNFVGETPINWNAGDPDNPEGRRKQLAGIYVPAGSPIRFVNVRVEATGDTSERSGADYMCAWINPPAFGLSIQLSIAVNGDVTMEWFTETDARVSYVTSTERFATLLETYDHPDYTPTFANVTPAQSGSVVVGNAGFGKKLYVTATAWDNDDKRSSLPIGSNIFNDNIVSTTQDPAGATPDVDWALGPQHTLVLDQNCAPTFSNPVAGQTYTLTIEQDGTGGWTFTWPTSVKAGSGGLPTVTSTAGAEDIYELKVLDDDPQLYVVTVLCQDCS